MKLVATVRVKLNPDDRLLDMSDMFKYAVQYAIDKGFATKSHNRYKLHHLVYKDLRQWLTADFACEAIAKASENLKSTKKHPRLKVCPISFNRNLFTFQADKLRLSTLTPRQRIDIPIEIPQYYWKYLDWRYQTLELVQDRKHRLFAHITFSREVRRHTLRRVGETAIAGKTVEDTFTSCGNEKLGVDLGVNNLAVTSDGKMFKGHKTRLMQHHWLRRRLQRKGTKSAKRKLRALSGRQKRYMRWVNHNISKQIVSSEADTIVLEDLKGIRKARNKHRGKRLNRWLNSWAFYQLQQFITYKANFIGKSVVKVNPYMTSQNCSACGRHGSRYYDSFVCPHCGFVSHADLNAAFNLRGLPVTQPNVSVNDTEGHPTTEVDARDKSPRL